MAVQDGGTTRNGMNNLLDSTAALLKAKGAAVPASKLNPPYGSGSTPVLNKLGAGKDYGVGLSSSSPNFNIEPDG